MERKIGEIFNYDNIELIVRSGKTCSKCYFNDSPICKKNISITGRCSEAHRTDKETVYFEVWANKNPKSPWISVNNKMPYEYPELLEDRDTTVPILTKTERLGYFVQYMYYSAHRNEWEFTVDGGVEYWMPIPKIEE